MKPMFREFFRPGVFIGGFLVAIVLLIGLLALLTNLRAAPDIALGGTAALSLIPAPTYTIPQPTAPTAVVTVTLTPAATDVAATPPPADLKVGDVVQIRGTGQDGLRLRASPGLQAEIRFVALEAEVFQVKEGPRQADGYIWFYLVNPYQDNYQGWAVANYLALSQQSP